MDQADWPYQRATTGATFASESSVVRPWPVILGMAVVAAALAAPRPAGATNPGGAGMIAFETSGSDVPHDIGMMRPDGTVVAMLTDAAAECPYAEMPGGNYTHPAWSPDGRRLAFYAYTSHQGHCDGALHVADADGSNRRRVADVQEWMSGVSWSPDGRRLVFGDSRFGTAGVWRVDVDGTDLRRLGAGAHPSWSPDGTTIVAHAGDLVLMDADGGNRRPLVPGWDADWSPDGTRLVFVTANGRLAVIGADGSGFGLLGPDRSPEMTSDPSWSPDGGRILFNLSSTTGGPHIDLWMMNADGSNARRIAAFAQAGAWQPLPPVTQPVGLVDPATGIWRLARIDGTVAAFYYGNPGDYPIVGDWDCDGDETPGLYRRSDGYVYLRNSSTTGIADVRFFFGNPGDIPLAGDFDGDACDTVSIYRPGEGRVYVINELGSAARGLGAAEKAYYFGNPGDKPIVGDFDADGVETIGLHRESTGLVYFSNAHRSQVADHQFIFGDPGDRLVCGDWNGAGADSPAVFRPGDATFYFRHTNTPGVADTTIPWGEPHWLPVAGDFGLG